MFQVCIKTTEKMLGFYSYVLATEKDRDEFVKGPDVWWYCYGDADDWYWHKGGAWRKTEDVHLPELPREGTIEADRRALDFARAAIQRDEQDEDDGDEDRW